MLTCRRVIHKHTSSSLDSGPTMLQMWKSLIIIVTRLRDDKWSENISSWLVDAVIPTDLVHIARSSTICRWHAIADHSREFSNCTCRSLHFQSGSHESDSHYCCIRLLLWHFGIARLDHLSNLPAVVFIHCTEVLSAQYKEIPETRRRPRSPPADVSRLTVRLDRYRDRRRNDVAAAIWTIQNSKASAQKQLAQKHA